MMELSKLKKRLFTPVFAAALLAGSLGAAPSDMERARALYQRADYAAALELLSSTAPKTAAVYQLMGLCYYQQADAKKASEQFERAVNLEPANPDYHLWFGRALGRRAETSSFITAPGLASKAREQFERAVELSPRNTEAMSDLFEFYVEAPGILGGGLDKAAALAEKMGQVNPAEYHWAQARLAEKRKQYQAAEEQLRQAAALAPRQVGRLVDLAKFLAKTGRFDESERTLRQAETVAPDAPRLMFERASIYIQAGRNIPAARDLLKKYLQAPLTPNDPSRDEALRLLKTASAG
jgi:Flp pilus assembly protein TadD